MRPLSDTIARLAAFRHARDTAQAPSSDLAELTGFGSNLGALRAWTRIPADLPPHAPLVVVLHGCTQTAAAYDNHSGWSHLAEAQGFALLFPEQQRANNGHLCFNWFQPEDTRRDQGEAASIRQMIERLVLDHGLDRSRIFVTGLSAGGAMASTMLAAYPEVFAGGAIIAGLPYGVAGTVPQAFDRMRGHGMPDPARLEALVRGASDHRGPWPRISIWQGTTDRTVAPSNADAILDQWRGLHRVGGRPARVETVDGVPHEVWCDREGHAVIERYDIAGMGHGTPLDGAEPGETAGAYMLDVGVSSTRHIARFWGLAPAASRAPRKTAAPAPEPVGVIQQTIESALRQAGLMR
ncbi:PHB depolymerase family esterase [Roseococcus sp. SYP-B2431]|uniref:extracellular catalytic domain type 1 short-chain-length polyhydroxyalkanoate depolymerase n=1 Tax=Roseococcus sp. SYP-B2431 TaxID=2496640 RepID=UPI00104061C5|nr:PHB depolymerase family esterase [Roseococcus sp. SYP-B2431]TCH98536.1 PHB depolymerase family esterase [Roseococcus sp. SYP-B2431]